MVLVAPSLLSADFADLKGQIAQAEHGGADWLHLDVMDGHFTPNMTIGPVVIRSLRRLTKLPFDVHLMIEEPDRYLEDFRSAGADSITVHFETCAHLHGTVQKIKSLGARAGVCINPATPETFLSGIIQDVDLVLIMSVNPGFGGQTFIPSSIEKIRRTASMLRTANPAALLEVDGGIDETTAHSVVHAGANVLVSGSYVFRSGDIPRAIAALRSKSLEA